MKTTKTISPRFKLLCCLLIGALVSGPLPLTAADMNAGYSFTPNDRVTSTKLNNLVGAGSINTTFISDKTTAQPQAADSFGYLSASASAFRKATLNVMFLQNTNLIVSQSEKVPLTNDWFLLYSTADNAFRKTTLLDLVTNTAFIDGQLRSTNAPLPGGLFLGSSNGVFYAYALTNILQEWWRWMPFSTNSPTNALLSLHTAPTNDDLLLVWDSVAKTNKAMRLQTLVSNSTRVNVNVTNSSDYLLWGMRTNDTNIISINPKRLFPSTSTVLVVPNADITYTSAHGLPGLPQSIRAVLVCTNAEFGFTVGEEVELVQVACNGLKNGDCSVASDATNVYVTYQGGANAWSVFRHDTDASVSITKVNWNVKWYARYFPQ